jgi:hypothetical protein
MIRPTQLMAAAATAFLLACGGDDDGGGDVLEPVESAEETTTSAPDDEETTTTADADDDTGGSDEEPTISRGDAEQATGRAAMDASEGVEGSDLYFNLGDGVVCESPDADQPDNLNERASRWSCEVDHEVNGVRCVGTAEISAEGERLEEEAVIDEADITCEPA